MKCVRLVNIVRYWLKIVQGEKSPYVTKCLYECLGAMETNDGKCWVNRLKAVLKKRCLVIYGCNKGDEEIFLKGFEQRVLYIFRQNWSENLSMSSRAVFYRSVKEKWVFSEYLDMVHVTKDNKALCRLIVISSHSYGPRQAGGKDFRFHEKCGTVNSVTPMYRRRIPFPIKMSCVFIHTKTIDEWLLLGEILHIQLNEAVQYDKNKINHSSSQICVWSLQVETRTDCDKLKCSSVSIANFVSVEYFETIIAPCCVCVS